MSKEDLKETLEELRAEVDKLDDADDKVTRERMTKLLAELEEDIEEADQDREESILDSVKELIEEFEESHPDITGILNQISMTLSNMGI